MSSFFLNKIMVQVIICFAFALTGFGNVAIGATYDAQPGQMLKIKISKTGLNRISNPPYKITQVTGDESSFRLKSDEDGDNIYLMPLAAVGETIELSIKNNAGIAQDVQLTVSDGPGQIVVINARPVNDPFDIAKEDVARMLRAMRDGTSDKFYVQESAMKLDSVGDALVIQKKIYKFGDIVGGVFEVRNASKIIIELDLDSFVKRFDNVIASFSESLFLDSKEKTKVFIVQKIAKS